MINKLLRKASLSGLILLAALAACSDSSGPDSDYLPLCDPESVIENFVVAWEAMDIEGYSRLLYDGVTPLAHGDSCAPYKSHLTVGLFENPIWPYEEECQHSEALFSGSVGLDGCPGVESIQLTLTPHSDWEPVPAGTLVLDDAAPEGTLVAIFRPNLLVILEDVDPENGPESIFTHWKVTLHVIPVQGFRRVEYRLWKWQESLWGKDIEPISWSELKENW